MENQHENENDPSHFFILIPSEVLANTKLSEGAKLLYGEILFLSIKYKYCFATNDYFSKLNNVSKRAIGYRLKELKNQNLIRIEVIRNEQNRQIDKRFIYISQDFANKNRHVTVQSQNPEDDKKETLILGEHQNVFITEQELAELHQKFSKQLFDTELPVYSSWKKTNNANPNSDYKTIEKWLTKKQDSFKRNTTAVIQTGSDEVSQEILENLPF